MPQKEVDVSEGVQSEGHQAKDPEKAECYELVRPAYSVTFTVYVNHDQFMPPQFQEANRHEQDVVDHKHYGSSYHDWNVTDAQYHLIALLRVFTRQKERR